MDKVQALKSFYSLFSLPAYEENSVPKDAKHPYLTFNIILDSFGGSPAALSASLWYRSSSWTDALAKEKEISEFIGRGGVNLPCDNGFVWIMRGSPFSQPMGDPSDDLIKRIYMNINAEFITID